MINNIYFQLIVIILIFIILFFLLYRSISKRKYEKYEIETEKLMVDYSFNLADAFVKSMRNPAIIIIDGKDTYCANNDFLEMINPLSVEEYLENDFYLKNFKNNNYEHHSYDIELNRKSYYAGFDIIKNKYLNGIIVTYLDVSYIKDFYALQDVFISDLKHEVKTPITAIAGLSDVLLHRDDLDKKDIDKILITIREEIYRLNDLISRLTSVLDQKVNFEMINLDDFFEDLNIIYKGKKLEIPIHFSNFIDEGIYSDRKILKQIIINLVDNAVKFTKDGYVKVSAIIEDEAIKIAVVDTGAGIDKSEQAKIFERFYRKNKFDNPQNSGYGLGLNIVSDLLKKINGEISVKSKTNLGTTFTIELPIKKIQE